MSIAEFPIAKDSFAEPPSAQPPHHACPGEGPDWPSQWIDGYLLGRGLQEDALRHALVGESLAEWKKAEGGGEEDPCALVACIERVLAALEAAGAGFPAGPPMAEETADAMAPQDLSPFWRAPPSRAKPREPMLVAPGSCGHGG